MNLCVAIPTMNRWRFLSNMLPVYIQSPYIKNIAICDEIGTDIDKIQKIYDKYVLSGKLILQKNKTCLGPYMNKYESIKLVGPQWVALLDSDNIFTDDDFFAPLVNILETETPDINMIYAPAAVKFIRENTNETEMPFLKYDGLIVDASNWSDITATPEGRRLLNDGNYVLHGHYATQLWPQLDISETSGADTFIANYYLVARGARIYFTKALGYTHIIHSESITETEHHKTKSVLDDPKWITM